MPATLAVARVLIPDIEPFIAISVYGRMAPLYAQTAVLRLVADLIPLFDTPRLKRRIVLGGDLNGHTQTRNLVERRRWRAILDVVESLGLVNLLKQTQPDRGRYLDCNCDEVPCYHVETHRHRAMAKEQRGSTNDYLFASKDLARRLTGTLEIWGDRPEVWQLSDHCPIVARFDL